VHRRRGPRISWSISFAAAAVAGGS
jgi:hypothetical protein